jgi:hypothetical protein
LISHKKHMMFEYAYLWLIDNKCLRMHLLFHLYLKYNTFFVYEWIECSKSVLVRKSELYKELSSDDRGQSCHEYL